MRGAVPHITARNWAHDGGTHDRFHSRDQRHPPQLLRPHWRGGSWPCEPRAEPAPRAGASAGSAARRSESAGRRQRRQRGNEKGPGLAAELGKYRPDCIVFGGSPTVAVPGHGSDKIIVEKIERASGRRTFAAQAAAIEALQKYSAKKLALATPFPDNVNALVKDFLEKSGFEVLSIRGSGVDYRDLTQTPLQTSLELGKRVFEEARRADALYFPGAPQPCADIIEPLEKELGALVISSLQASLWKALQIIRYQVPVEGYGRLLRDLG